VFVSGHYTTKSAKKGKKGQAGSHIEMDFDDLDIEEDIRLVLKKRIGRTVILYKYALENGLHS